MPESITKFSPAWITAAIGIVSIIASGYAGYQVRGSQVDRNTQDIERIDANQDEYRGDITAIRKDVEWIKRSMERRP